MHYSYTNRPNNTRNHRCSDIRLGEAYYQVLARPEHASINRYWLRRNLIYWATTFYGTREGTEQLEIPHSLSRCIYKPLNEFEDKPRPGEACIKLLDPLDIHKAIEATLQGFEPPNREDYLRAEKAHKASKEALIQEGHLRGNNPCQCATNKFTPKPDHRTWVVLHRNAAFDNSYQLKPSNYSTVRCTVCGGVWRTKAKYVSSLPDLEQ